MTAPLSCDIVATDLDAIATAEGRIVVFVPEDGRLDQAARRVNRLTRGAVERAVAAKSFADLKPGGAVEIGYPSGLAAEAVQIVKMPRRPASAEARAAGVAIGKAAGGKPLLLLAGSARRIDEVLLGLMLRAYTFTDLKSKAGEPAGGVTVMVTRPDDLAAAAAAVPALAEGVFFTRDLVNLPSNILTTSEFARRLEELAALGLTVEVLDEPALEELGMRTLLAVGQGSASPSKVVVMQWTGGARGEAPLALVGKGVCFDTGGISLKPAAGMEDMTMDMGGAAVVAGVMKALALRQATANVVGLVGLVENMPSGEAIRPGDVVTSMKGDTVEIINTDAEGRLVLADVLWYAQDRFAPRGIVDLATLTGAMIIALGHETAGLFSNDDALCSALLRACDAEGEDAWRLPLGPAYDEMLKSDIADMKNVGGRPAGAITAAQFLQRFVRPETPWVHIDIAGVASTKSDSRYAPKGASGWGVLALNRLVDDLAQG